MTSAFERGKEAVRHERAIRSLLDLTGAPVAEVRSLFAQEFSRLELGAKIRSYLAVLTASNVRAMLRRKRGATAVNAHRDDTLIRERVASLLQQIRCYALPPGPSVRYRTETMKRARCDLPYPQHSRQAENQAHERRRLPSQKAHRPAARVAIDRRVWPKLPGDHLALRLQLPAQALPLLEQRNVHGRTHSLLLSSARSAVSSARLAAKLSLPCFDRTAKRRHARPAPSP